MRITRKQLLRIITETILLEGQAEDLVGKFPELQPAYDAGIKNPQYLQWIQKRRAGEPVEDIIGVVQTFNSVKQRLKATGMSPDIYTYKTPALLRQALEDLGGSKGAETRRLKDEETTYLGTFGEWIVAMPHTRESSCQLGKGTTWCTAATQSQNLFLSYVARHDQNVILYYILKKGADPREDSTAKLSVGFVDGEPILDGQDGHMSVDANNKGLDERRLSQILGDQFEPIMTVMKENASSIEGKHPAKKQMQKIAKSKDPSVIDKYVRGMEEDEREEFLMQMLEFEPSPEILAKLSDDKNLDIRAAVAGIPSTPLEILAKLSDDDSRDFRAAVAGNPSTPPQILAKLSDDEKPFVRMAAARNPSAPPQILAKLSVDKDSHVRAAVARNPSTPPQILAKLSDDEDRSDRRAAARNPSTPLQILAKLSDDDSPDIRAAVAGNPSTPPQILAKLSVGGDRRDRAAVARNLSTPPQILAKLSVDEDHHVRMPVAVNPSTPPQILAKLSVDEKPYIRAAIAKNPSTPPQILAKLFDDGGVYVRRVVANNPTFKAYKNSQIQNINELWIKIAGLIK